MTSDPPSAAVPQDARPVNFDELFAAIGELYFQNRVLRQVIAAQHAQPTNGKVEAWQTNRSPT